MASNSISLPLVSPLSNHSTVTLRESMLMPDTTAEWIRPEKKNTWNLTLKGKGKQINNYFCFYSVLKHIKRVCQLVSILGVDFSKRCLICHLLFAQLKLWIWWNWAMHLKKSPCAIRWTFAPEKGVKKFDNLCHPQNEKSNLGRFLNRWCFHSFGFTYVGFTRVEISAYIGSWWLQCQKNWNIY